MSYPLLCPLLRTAPGSTQPKVPMSLCTQAGRGITIVSPSSGPLGAIVPGPDFNKPLTVCSSAIPVNSQPAAVVTAAQTATGQQPKVPLHVSSQMTVNQARNAVRTGKFYCEENGYGSLYERGLKCAILFYFPICSRVSQSGPAHRSSDTHPVCNTCDLSPTSCRVPAAFLQSGPRLHPGRSCNGLCCYLSDPTQCQRCILGG